MHSLAMLRAYKTQIGFFEGNPFQERLWELSRRLPIEHGRCFVPGFDKFVDGEVREAFEEAVEVSRRRHVREVEPVATMLLRVPKAKATNFYQASRAATYVSLADQPAIVEGGTLYVEADCPEMIGEGAGEQACADAMKRGREALLEELKRDDPPAIRGGAQRAYVLALALGRVDIVLVGPRIDGLDAMGIRSIDASPEVARVVEDPFHAVPIRSTK